MRRWAGAMGIIGLTAAVGVGVRVVLLGGLDERGVALALLAAVLLLTYALLGGDEARAAVQRPGLRVGLSSAGLVGIALVAAVLAYGVVRRVDTVVDLTRRGSHTLAPATLAALDGLDREVALLAFFRDGTPVQRRFARLATRLDARSERLTVRFVDPLDAPLLARTHDVTQEAGEVVLVAGERTERLTGRFDEGAVVRALQRLTATTTHRICWAEGHGEADPDDTRTADGAGALVTALDGSNHEVVRLVVPSEGVPSTCDAVVVAGPRVDWRAAERSALLRYVAAGGRVLVLLEPGVTPALARSLGALGLSLGPDVVLDADPRALAAGAEDPSVLVIPPRALRDHPITAALPGALRLSLARRVAQREASPGVAVRTLVHAGPSSWAETDWRDDADGLSPDPDEAQGEVPLAAAVEVLDPDALAVPGAMPVAEEARALVAEVFTTARSDLGLPPDDRTLRELGLGARAADALAAALASLVGDEVAVTADDTVGDVIDRVRDRLADAPTAPPDADLAPAPGGRAVVVGDAGFVRNRDLAFGSHRDLALSAVAWLVGEDDQLGGRPPDLGDPLPLSGRDLLAISLMALFVWPALAIAGAVLAWRRRRSG